MRSRRRPARLNLIKPDEVEPDVWEILTAAYAGKSAKIGRLLTSKPKLHAEEFWYTRAIHFAVREGHLRAVQTLLDHGDDSTWVRYGHEDLAVVARDRGHEDVAKLLIADRVTHNVDALRPIHTAAGTGQLVEVASLLASDGDQAKIGDGEGWTPLHHAVHGGHFSTVALLVDSGAEVDKMQRGGSSDWYRARNQRPVDIALKKDDRLMVGFLLAKGAEYTLDLATLAGDEDAIRRLCKSKISRKFRGGQALEVATKAGNEKLVEVLLSAGVEPSTPLPNAPKGAALWHASSRGHHAIAAMLLDAGADPDACIESSGSPLHQAKDDAMKALMYRYGARAKSAADFVLDGNIDGLAALIDHDKSAVSVAGCGTVYTYAVSFGKTHFLDLLLARRVPVPPVVTGCRSYLWRRPEMTRRLLEAGMDPNLPNWQWATPLHNIAETNPMWVRKGYRSKEQKAERAARKGLVDLFIEFGADINALDEEYRSTPLGWAVRNDQKDMVDLLLSRGADPNGGEVWARPLAWAERRRNRDLVKLLKKAGAV